MGMRAGHLRCGRAARRWRLLALGIAAAAGQAAAFAETIHLKDGTSVEGRIVERRPDGVVVELESGGRVPYWLDEIQRVDASTPLEPEAAKDAPAPDAPRHAEATAASNLLERPNAEGEPEQAADEGSAPGRAAVPEGWELFRSADDAVRLMHPEGWRARERIEQSGYRVLIEPDAAVSRGSDDEGVVIDVTKAYRATQTAGVGQGSPDEQLDRYLAQLIDAGQGSLLGQRSMTVQEAPARLAELEMAEPSGSVHHVLLLLAIRHDVLASVFCEAPPERFERIRPVCEHILTGAQLFADDLQHPDNVDLREPVRVSPPAMPPAARAPQRAAPSRAVALPGVPSVTFQLPALWSPLLTQQSEQFSFETSQDPSRKLLGYLRTFPVPAEPDRPPPTAMEWALREVAALQDRGLRVTTSPTNLQAGSVKWVTLAWEAPFAQGGAFRFRGEQFYLAGGLGMVEAFVSGPAIVFTRTDRAPLYAWLSSVQAPPSASPQAVAAPPSASHTPSPVLLPPSLQPPAPPAPRKSAPVPPDQPWRD